MKKVLLTTVHPAPYINGWVEKLKINYEIEVLYYLEKSKYKAYTDFIPCTGKYMGKLTYIELYRCVLHSDLIILGGWKKIRWFFLLLCGRLLKRKVALFSDYPMPQKKNLIYLVKKCIFRSCLDYVLCATKSTCNYYASLYGFGMNRLYIFPYASVDIDHINKNYWPIRIEEIAAGDKIRVFIANSFFPRKGYNTVVKALERLKCDGLLNRFSFRIAGIGDEYEVYEKKFQELDADIKLLGWLEDSEYNLFMQNTDIYIHASSFEPFGIPPIDAMIYGKVLIVSKGVKSVEAFIVDGVNGYTICPNDHNKLYEHLKYILQNTHSMEKVGNEATNEIGRHYNNNIVLETLNKLFSQHSE